MEWKIKKTDVHFVPDTRLLNAKPSHASDIPLRQFACSQTQESPVASLGMPYTYRFMLDSVTCALDSPVNVLRQPPGLTEQTITT